MFKIDPNPTFEACVQVRMPGGDRRTIRVEFKHLDQEAYTKAFEQTKGQPLAAFAAHLVAGWKTEDGKSAAGEAWEGMSEPYTPEALERLGRKQLYVVRAISDAWHREALGLPEKN